MAPRLTALLALAFVPSLASAAIPRVPRAAGRGVAPRALARPGAVAARLTMPALRLPPAVVRPDYEGGPVFDRYDEPTMYPLVYAGEALTHLKGVRAELLTDREQVATPDELIARLTDKVERNQSWSAIAAEDVDDPAERRTLEQVRTRFLPALAEAIAAARADNVFDTRMNIAQLLRNARRDVRTAVGREPGK